MTSDLVTDQSESSGMSAQYTTTHTMYKSSYPDRGKICFFSLLDLEVIYNSQDPNGFFLKISEQQISPFHPKTYKCTNIILVGA